MTQRDEADVAIVGAGAAGLATAVFASQARSGRVLCLDGATHIGAKILVSGGGRCNVTNRRVTERDFNGSSPRLIRNVLRAFPADRAAGFFEQEGIRLSEEDDGKLFPASHRSRDVRDALLAAAAREGALVQSASRVTALERHGERWVVSVEGRAPVSAAAVVLATGGQSLPKSGSDGNGYQLARGLGHSIVPTTPALVPLLVDDPLCATLSGVSHRAEMRVVLAGRVTVALEGPILWTHFGVSGPLALDASRHWLRAGLTQSEVQVQLAVLPGMTFDAVEQWLLEQQRERPRALVLTVLGSRLPQAVAEAWLSRSSISRDTTVSTLTRDARRRLVHALTGLSLPVTGSRGYNFAEVTAGGVPLAEVDTATMASRVCPGLYLVGELLDVDGRLGGFNFQWAWSTAWVAGQALGRRLTEA